MAFTTVKYMIVIMQVNDISILLALFCTLKWPMKLYIMILIRKSTPLLHV